VVEPGNHRAAGGGEARHRFEVRVGHAQARQRQQQRQRAENRQQRPGEAHEQEAVARLQLAPEAPRSQAHRATEAGGDQRRQQEGTFTAVVADPGEAERHQHEGREQRHQASDQCNDRERAHRQARPAGRRA
jgi:hypothetical protein